MDDFHQQQLAEFIVFEYGAAKWQEAARLCDSSQLGSPVASTNEESFCRTIAAASVATGAEKEGILAGYGRQFVRSLAKDVLCDRVRTRFVW